MTNKTNSSPRARKELKAAGPKPDRNPRPLINKGVTKQAQLIQLLQQEAGATTIELASALSWLPHTTRAALTGLRKKGHDVRSEKVDGETRYRIEGASA